MIPYSIGKVKRVSEHKILHELYLERVFASEEMDDLESMLHNPHGHQLLT